jgi:hypothetical protein
MFAFTVSDNTVENPLENSFQKITNEIDLILKNLKRENDLQSDEAAGILTARIDDFVKETVNQSIFDLKEKKNIDLSEKREELNHSIDRIVTQKAHDMISKVLGKTENTFTTPNRYKNLKTPDNRRAIGIKTCFFFYNIIHINDI